MLPFIFKGTTRTATPEELAIAAAASLPCPDDSDSDNDCLCLFEVLHIVNYLYIIGSLMANAYLFARLLTFFFFNHLRSTRVIKGFKGIFCFLQEQ